MRNRYLLGAGVALAVALSWANAQAQLFALPPGPGALYFGIEGGWTNLEDATDRVGKLSFKQRWDDGFNVGARAGYELGPLRFEEEFNFKDNQLTRLTFPGVSIPVRGQRNAYAIMTNAIYDFTLGWPVTPHLGVGIGAVELHDSISRKIPAVPASISSSSQWEFGYQGIAGIRYNINPALAFDLDYRYLATTDPTFRTVTGAKYRSEYSTHNIVASLSVRFGAPPPPPIAPPPPVVQRRVFLVFFDWDKDTITREGMEIIRQAADTPTPRARSATTSACPSVAPTTSPTRCCGSACRASRCSSVAGARTTSACRPQTVCASRRTAALRSSSRRRSRYWKSRGRV
jgi:OmpA-OmpF porin, OOP family